MDSHAKRLQEHRRQTLDGARVERRVLGRAIEAALIAGVYFLAAKTGLRLASLHPSATPVWPPTGIAIAALLLRGAGAWPGIFLGAFAANLTTAGTVWTSLGVATGNTLEAVVAAHLVNRYAGGRRAFARLEDIVRFAIAAGLLSTAISATVGLTSLALGGFAPWRMYAPIWLTWWLGDAAGALVVTPLLLLWAAAPRLGWTGRGAAERMIFFVAILVASLTVFGSRYPFGFAIVPFLIWAAFRFGARDAVTVVALVSAVAVVGTIHQLGPFGVTVAQPSVALSYLSLFMGIMAIIALTVARIVEDRAAAADELRRRVLAEEDARRTAERAVEQATRLASVTTALSEAVTPRDVAAVIVTHAVEALGARAAGISLLADDGRLELIHATGYPAEILRRWQRFLPSQFGGIEECMRTGRVVWLETEADLQRHYPEREELPGEIRHGARAAVPLVTRGSAVGVLYLNFGVRRRLGDDEITFMRTLGHQCAQAVERARLYEREHHVAGAFQRALLPVEIPQVPGLAIHTVYQPGAQESNVGGDWYDVLRLPSGKIVVSIGDVAGRGLTAAVIMGELRQTIRTAALQHDNPAAVLDQASQALALAHGHDTMATAIVAILDPESSRVSYATAGHPAPVLAVPGGDPVVLPAAGVPLGFLAAPGAPSWTVTLPAGALLVLYTDGLIELERDVVAGQDALIRAARRALAGPSDDPARAILQAMHGGGRAADDVAIITLALDAAPLDRFDLTLPAEPSSAAVIRQTVRRLARVAALDEKRAAALAIAVGEAVNNTIEHAYRATAGTVHVQGVRDAAAVRVIVGDSGAWRPARAPDGGGHGLHLIEQLADSVDVMQTPTGTTVTIVMRQSHGDPAPAAATPEAAAGIAAAPSARPPERRPAAPVAGAGPDDASPGAGLVTVHSAAPPQSDRAGARLQRRDGMPVVEAFGDLDVTCVDAVRRVLAEAAHKETATVIVSLEEVGYIDSLTIRELFAFGRDLMTRRRALALVVPPGSALERIVDVAGLTRQFRVFASVADACAAGTEVPRHG
ncbi:MAG TPA: MASE1 domain-containing protein [bacterium]|nr:MASE1 domain-containing protein [bacterium]